MKIVKFAIFLANLAYPFALVFMPNFTELALVLLAVLWGVKFYISKELFDGGICAFFLLAFFASGIKFYYPIIVSMAMFWVFSLSLKSTPMITRFALVKEPNLSQDARVYTRKLTKIWMGFFVFNALIAFVLSLFDDKSAWAIYTGFVSYLLIGALFFGEILFRRFVLKV